MKTGIWKILAKISEGVMMSFAARIAAWGALIAVVPAWQLLGHTIGDLTLHVASAMVVH